MRLKLERFGLPNKPSETPAPVWAMVRNRKISRAKHQRSSKSRFGAETGEGRLRAPSPCPLPQGDNPSVRCGG